MLKKTLLSLCVLLSTFILLPLQAGKQYAQEVHNALEHDKNFEQDEKIEDSYLKTLSSLIDRCHMIATSTSTTLDFVTKHLFFHLFPGPLLHQDSLLLTGQNAPELYAAMGRIAHKLQIPQPPLFLSGNKELFNAFACGFSHNHALVVLGKKLIDKVTDQELESVLAHEAAHIKYYDVPKRMAAEILGLSVALFFLYKGLTAVMLPEQNNLEPEVTRGQVIRCCAFMTAFVSTLIVLALAQDHMSRLQEQAADQEAIKALGGDAFVGSMEALKRYYEDKINAIQKDYQLLEIKLQKLELVSPRIASWIDRFASNHVDAIIQRNRRALESDDGSHPSIEKRIAYGKQALSA